MRSLEVGKAVKETSFFSLRVGSNQRATRMYEPASLRSMERSARSLMRRTSAPSTSHSFLL